MPAIIPAIIGGVAAVGGTAISAGAACVGAGAAVAERECVRAILTGGASLPGVDIVRVH
ncbi:MAG: hypothetical protein H0X27_07760 [Caulobacteraceae bacterium]|nr:hypothetical protein [Caulobacteraceae bacterium]